MLTASLQSTWDTQRNLQRPKYGPTGNFQLNYLNSNNSGNNGNYTNAPMNGQLIDDKNGSSRTNYGVPQHHPTYYSGNYPELPNLKVSNPHQNANSRLLLPQAGGNGTMSMASPRNNNPYSNINNNNYSDNNSTRELINMQNKKNRASSRQSNHKSYRRHHRNPVDAMGYQQQSDNITLQGPSLNHSLHNENTMNVLPQIAVSSSSNFNNTHNNKRAMYINGNVNNSPPSPKANNNPLVDHTNNATAAPIVREFTSGNMLTNTEEHPSAAVTSIRGLKPANPNWINQDNFFITENFDGRDFRIYCVLDGHGEHGHLVSRRCRENFPLFIKSSRLEVDSAFKMMQNDLNAASEMDVRCSGATCVLATVYNGKLTVYNCGDSRAVLGRRNPNGSLNAIALSKDHKPDKAEERKRILSCGGHLGCRQVLVNQPGRGPVSMPVGPCRVWYQHRGETLGLAMSRSLGDSIVHKSGVSAEPEILERVIDDFDDFFILASDGVWDVVDNNYAVQIVQSVASKSPNWSPIEASNSICRYARSRWEKLSPMIDDITCIVVKIHR